jgi:hypothetical protein
MENNSQELLKTDELSGHTELFGWKFREGGNNGLIEIYVEDDDFWNKVLEFDTSWIHDFHQLGTALLFWHNCQISNKYLEKKIEDYIRNTLSYL